MLLPVLLAIGAIVFAAGLGVAIYRLSHRFWPATDRDGMDLTSVIIVRIGILHALIVALAFTEVKQNEMHARQLVAEEAVTVANVFYDLERFNEAVTLPARQLVVRYARDVVHGDWPELAARGRLSEQAWTSWRVLLESVLALEPRDRRQNLIHARMLENTWKLEEQRQRRGSDAHAAPHPVFWFTSIAGLMVICACLAPYPARRSTELLVAAFSGFTGVVVYFAYDVTTPFNGLWPLTPAGLLDFLQQARPAAVLAGL
ncbi:bestrophin-like domain [Roseococcus pinisoli]|uniref:DUF4239 domain-containing protein n=1 Tax=Roseococcus pinisoli TaxID=2835040 RepID=A0ABS5QCA5_9PROT|nr:DUF4239 domain-containing protein [Roseococcus pinisoli]MBS7811311.1 DUF4239 domain-containing protein [Roseococcus pinisoli]